MRNIRQRKIKCIPVLFADRLKERIAQQIDRELYDCGGFGAALREVRLLAIRRREVEAESDMTGPVNAGTGVDAVGTGAGKGADGTAKAETA
jgi:hypothetical protein